MNRHKFHKLQTSSSRSRRSLSDKLRSALFKSHVWNFLNLLDEGADVNTRDRHNNTPLHLVIRWKKDISILEAVLSAGADPNAIDRYGNTPLHKAIQSKSRPAIIKALLNAGADVSIPDKYGNSVLVKAIFAQNNNPLLQTLHPGTNIMSQNLMGIVKPKPDHELIRSLIMAGAPINDNTSRFPPIFYAVWNGDPLIIKMLIAAGAKLDYTDPDTQSTLLHEAKSAAAAQELINHGLSVNRVNIFGETPLHSAVKFDLLDVVMTLIRAGGDIRGQVQRKGDNCMHLAGSAQMVKMLSLRGVNINAFNSSGLTPLHAILQGTKGFSTLLVSYEDTRSLPYFMQRIHKGKQGAREMLRCGADVNAISHNANVRTILELAVYLGDPGMVASMIRRGVKAKWGNIFCLHIVDNRGIQLLIREAVIGNVKGDDLDAYPISEIKRPLRYLISYIGHCKDEIELMKVLKVNCNTTVHHYVVETAPRIKALRLCSHYEVNVEEYTSMFPLYRNKVAARLNKCYRRAALLDILQNVEVCVPTADGQRVVSLINDCKFAIAEQLSNEDLFEFLIAMGMKFQKGAIHPKPLNCCEKSS